jgi:hypothetical protein
MKPISTIVLSTLILLLAACASAGTSSLTQRLGSIDIDNADAAGFAMDVSASTISFPTDGTATLTLKDSRSGTAVATREFGWRRGDKLLKLTEPDAVNEWVRANKAGADTLAFELKPFPLVSGSGEQRMIITSMYEGKEIGTSTSLFYVCATQVTRTPCGQ